MRRHLLGGIAILLLATGIVGLSRFGLHDSQTSSAISGCLRCGLVLGAIWLALPQIDQILQQYSPWTIAAVFGGLIVVLLQPKLLLFVGIALAALAAFQFVLRLFKQPPRPPRAK